MTRFSIFISLCFFASLSFGQTQTVQDDFEGNGSITSWAGDDCNINISFSNPYIQGINTSATVLKYDDYGGQYANVRFQLNQNFDLSVNHTFTLKVYLESSSITGSQTNQISLKLQDGTLTQPWSTQCEIIKTVAVDQWQEVTFNFDTDPYINLNAGSGDPVLRTDFNRVVLQINSENNNDLVTAFVDDISYDGTVGSCPTYNTLVWSDEFDGSGAIDGTKWFHQTQLPNGWGWHNGEVQHYTNRTDNSYLQDGYLHLVAKKESFTDQGHTKTHTSARLNSKFAFTYGRVDVRAKLPTGSGTWPAIWMLGKNINETGAYWQTQGFGNTNWPACGEIDIMEHWGNNQNFVQSAMHTPSSSGATVNHGGLVNPTASDSFHVYSMVWTPDSITFSLDGTVYYTYNPVVKDMNTWPYVADQFLLLNTAIESSIDPAFSQSDMVLDYVRVYQEDGIDLRSACDSLNWVDGNTYTTNTSNVSHTLADAIGCDSTVTLNLTIKHSSSATDAITSCAPFTWIDNNSYSSNNNSATYIIQNSAGCDSTVTLDLTIKQSSTATDPIVSCAPFTWIDNNSYNSNNTSATHVIQNAAGCDSTITLNLTIVTPPSSTDLISSCNPIIWLDGNTYSTNNNTATYSYPTSFNCDSVVTLDLTINTVDTSTVATEMTISSNANGATYQWLDCNNSMNIIADETNESYTATESGSYAVRVTENGCTDTSGCTTITATIGIMENALHQNFVVFPNPATNSTTIQFEEIQSHLTIRIRSYTGQLIRTEELINSNQMQLDLQELSGMFLIEIENSLQQRALIKLIKKQQ